MSQEIDKMIERLKNTTKTIVDLMKELEDTRHSEIKDLHKRVSTLEYEFARHLENKNRKGL